MIKKTYIRFRLTKLEKAIMQKKAENCNLSLSAFIRKSALNQKVSYRLTSDEIEAYKTLQVCARNFQSLANLYSKKDPSFRSELEELAKEVKQHLAKFR